MANSPRTLADRDLDTASAGHSGDVEKVGLDIRLPEASRGQWVQQALSPTGAWASRSDA